MEHIDAANMPGTVLNRLLEQKLAQCGEVAVENSHSMHNIATGLSTKGRVIINGSTGFYTGGFMEGTSVTVEGNAGWYAGDNMMDGELVITKNAGCNAGTYFYGGTMIVRGNAGSRAGYGMKGGTIVICGDTGRWTGQMTLGGRLVLLGKTGKQLGESMYRGVIFIRDKEAEGNLGGNVFLDGVTSGEAEELGLLFEKYGIAAAPGEFSAVRPMTTGRHTYVLFMPELKPELSRKKAALR